MKKKVSKSLIEQNVEYLDEQRQILDNKINRNKINSSLYTASWACLILAIAFVFTTAVMAYHIHQIKNDYVQTNRSYRLEQYKGDPNMKLSDIEKEMLKNRVMLHK